jgi:DNA mismatch repair protein MutS
LKYITKKQKVDLINADIDISLLDNITCIKSTKSNTSLINNKIIGLCKTVYSGKDKILKLENELFKSIIAEFINTYHDDIETITGIITQLDVAQAKTYNAYKYNYCKPTLDIGGTKANADSNDELPSYVDFEDIRHPLIEQLLNKKGESYVTNNLKLGGISEDCCDYESYNGMLLYGTNAVGKTSLIRAIGISVIMAQAGMFVPCSRFTYRPYKYIFTRILGNDNIFKGLSTFAVEMTELRTILKYCDKNSLILGDELCSGTESDSAIAIFVTGLMKLHEIGSCFIFATHFHEIVKFEEVLDLDRLTMKHMKVIYNRETGKLEYDRKLTDGHGDSMYGLEVCEAMHLPADFVKCARNIRLKYSSTAEGGNTSVLGLKQSRYNAAVLMGDCVKCGKKGEDIHHLQHQSEADNRGFIGSMHKNHSSNLVSLCRKCHDLEHKH